MINEKGGCIRHICFDDVYVALPQVEQWSESSEAPDIFIAALGFEERAMAISSSFSRQFNENSTSIALVGCYDSNSADNDCNAECMNAALSKFCSEQRFFCADNPAEIKNTIVDAIREVRAKKDPVRVIIDISGSSGTLILSAMAALFTLAPPIQLEVVYAEPLEYSPTKADYERRPEETIKEGLSEGDDQSYAEQGVSDVDVNELYPGHTVENRRDRVIAIPSLRTSRLVRCLSHVGDQPLVAPGESIFWILSDPPSEKFKWRLDLQRMIILRQLATMVGKIPSDADSPYFSDTNLAMVSTRDYREILRALLLQIDIYAGSNLWLIHMGSKLQAIGVSLALFVRSEVTVLRARPKQFNVTKYSKGVGTLWRLKFDDISELIGQLRRVGQIELQSKIETSREGRPSI
jgi:hypothetical protein